MRENKLIQLYLTDKCNSKCNTCNIWKTKNIRELDIETLKELLLENKEADFVFGGGEAILYSEIEELLYFADKNNINYTLLSNCISINLLKTLILKYNVKNVTISCDGINHDTIRGSVGNLDKIKRFVEWANGLFINIKLAYTYSSFNENTIEEDFNMFKELGFSKVYFCLANGTNMLSDDEDVEVSDIKHLRKYYDMLYDKDVKFLESVINNNIRRCNSIYNVHTIDSNGDIILCQSYLSTIMLGNIYEDNFKKVVEDIDKDFRCVHDNVCNQLCQRRYD